MLDPGLLVALRLALRVLGQASLIAACPLLRLRGATYLVFPGLNSLHGSLRPPPEPRPVAEVGDLPCRADLQAPRTCRCRAEILREEFQPPSLNKKGRIPLGPALSLAGA
jgi:hypothetical protein